MSDHTDMHGWSPITCEQREDMVNSHTHGHLGVFSTITDPEGVYGSRLVYTEWGIADEGRPVLRDYLAYGHDGQPEKCTHYTQEQQ